MPKFIDVDPVLVLVDMLCAGADDLGIRLTARDARRLGPRLVELLEVAGYELHETPT